MYVSMIRKYHNHKLQNNPRHREEELQDIYSNKASKRQYWQINLLSNPSQNDCKKGMHTKTKSNTGPPQTMRGFFFFNFVSLCIAVLMIKMLILFLQNCNFTRIYFVKTDITITMPAILICFILKSKQQ